MSDPLWRPSPQRIAGANVTRFIDCVNARRAAEISDYDGLYRWSIEQPAEFWIELARFADVRADWGTGLALMDGDKMPGAAWFPGATLNFAANLLRFRDSTEALVFVGERTGRRALTYQQLFSEVARVAQGLRAAGVEANDRVAGFLPNIPEAVVAMLATASIGAIWSSCSPDFGINGVLDRFGQIEPKVLFTADGYFYGGKTLDSLASMTSVVSQLPSVQRVVVIPFASAAPSLSSLRNAIFYDQFGVAANDIDFAVLPFNHPLYILYSSGTTGVPKCIVHGAGGTLLQHQKEHLLHTDLKRGDRMFYFTTCGWMMWNWLVSGLATGATLILYDGSPFYPDRNVLWRLAESESITIFGTSAKYLAALEKAAARPGAEHDLKALHAILSTGSPLLPDSFDYVYQHIKEDLQLSSISGGTDIVSCFCLGSPVLPVYRGEIQTRGLGMRVEIVDESRQSVRGESGELVCTAPFPSMPLGFWNDPDDKRYHAAYFERFQNVWHHGDLAVLTEHDGIVILGRSDAVLNPGGVRIGTAEIYRQVETLPEVAESIAIGQQWRNDIRVVLFVRMQPGQSLDDSLRQRIKDTIRTNTTPRHVPARIVAVPDIPRTISGKIVELAVRDVVHGREVRNVDALANPEALEHFRNRPELSA
ncbi:MAG: acetoacetate--CoA ligase [Pseudomonadales bacterium]|nr:acetoacetate--CoA ligase [Pseudomonadales bacterium]